MTAGGNSFKNATAHKVNSYYTLAISYCTFCVGKHAILGPDATSRKWQLIGMS